MPRLWVYPPGAGPQEARAVELSPAGLGLGREADNDLVLADGGASRHHARLMPGEGGWVLEDLGSSNGTWVEGARIQRCLLLPGQAFRIGDTRLVLVEEGPPRPIRPPGGTRRSPPRRRRLPGPEEARGWRDAPWGAWGFPSSSSSCWRPSWSTTPDGRTSCPPSSSASRGTAGPPASARRPFPPPALRPWMRRPTQHCASAPRPAPWTARKRTLHDWLSATVVVREASIPPDAG
jgi:hypothetical protein